MNQGEYNTTCWLTVEECAVYLGLTRRAIYNHVHRGSLPYRKLGRRVLFNAAEVDKTLNRSPRSNQLWIQARRLSNVKSQKEE